MATPPSDKPDLENLSKDELIAMVMAAAEEKKEKACAPHDSAALACLLSRLGLARLEKPLKHWTLGAFLLRAENRVSLLSALKECGVTSLSDRQACINTITKHSRTLPMPRLDEPTGEHAVLDAPSLIESFGRHCGAVGLLIAPDGTCQHVNEAPRDHYGSCTYGTGLQQPKLDGPIVAEVARLAPLVGRPMYISFCDEDPFVAEPASSYTRNVALVDEPKLAAFRRLLGDDLVALCTAFAHDRPSVPRCVGLMPAFDSWAKPSDAQSDDEHVRWIMGLRTRGLKADVPYENRKNCAVWRGARTGGDPSTSLRGRVVELCSGKAWADVAFVDSFHGRGLRGGGEPGMEGMKAARELRREDHADYKIILCIDGHTWASSWEWALASGSVIIYLGVWAFHLIHSGELKPWVHYVPCERPELLEERVKWVLDFPKEAAKIALNAGTLFKVVATPEHTRKCVVKALVETLPGVTGAGGGAPNVSIS